MWRQKLQGKKKEGIIPWNECKKRSVHTRKHTKKERKTNKKNGEGKGNEGNEDIETVSSEVI